MLKQCKRKKVRKRKKNRKALKGKANITLPKKFNGENIATIDDSILLGNLESAYSVTFSPSGKMIMVSGKDENGNGIVKIWDKKSRKTIKQMHSNKEITFADFSPDEQLVYFVTAAGKIEKRSVNGEDTTREQYYFGKSRKRKRSKYIASALSPDGGLLVSYASQTGIEFFDIRKKKLLRWGESRFKTVYMSFRFRRMERYSL